MGRIMAIDYGLKRTGVAVTDPLQMLASPLTTVETKQALDFVGNYCRNEDVDVIVVGLPFRLNGEDTHATKPAKEFAARLKNELPGIIVDFEEEQFTSKKAMEAMVAGGMKKKDRRNKENIDKVSAAIILRTYLENK